MNKYNWIKMKDVNGSTKLIKNVPVFHITCQAPCYQDGTYVGHAIINIYGDENFASRLKVGDNIKTKNFEAEIVDVQPINIIQALDYKIWTKYDINTL